MTCHLICLWLCKLSLFLSDYCTVPYYQVLQQSGFRVPGSYCTFLHLCLWLWLWTRHGPLLSSILTHRSQRQIERLVPGQMHPLSAIQPALHMLYCSSERGPTLPATPSRTCLCCQAAWWLGGGPALSATSASLEAKLSGDLKENPGCLGRSYLELIDAHMFSKAERQNVESGKFKPGLGILDASASLHLETRSFVVWSKWGSRRNLVREAR